ncbi:MAG: pyruvate dehydrogenase (acetyl-transferring) E1 component subunit alpha [Phycisphaerales bacterium]|nr:pyruvate dehydrogenase (acetyl-transferring) E1 component subunit alpha [Phycisphaerales bacterium]
MSPRSANSTASTAPVENRPVRVDSNSVETIDLGRVEVIRVLDEKGRVVDAALEPGLPDDELLRLYRGMVRSRRFDQRMLAMQRQGEMGTFAPGLGQEATQIGQVYPMRPTDWYSPSYRSIGAQVWRGWTMEQLLLLWAGYFEGFAIPEVANELPFSIVIGSHVPVATGVAMGIKVRKDDAVVVTNFGDGASSQGVVAEAFNFAAVYKAPIVFIVESNGWAISTPLEKQAGNTVLAARGVGFGIPAVRVDGNDVLGMIAACTRAIDHARSGRGPYLVEAVTYRMSLHTTADDPKVYRKDEEVKTWEGKCPILRFESYLKSRDVLDDDAIARINEEIEAEVIAARDRFRELAVARPEEIFDFVYEQLPAELREQKAEYLERLKRKGVQ